MANTFSNNSNKENSSYAGINLEVKVNGEYVNLGSLFVTNKGTTGIAKEAYELLATGELEPSDLTLRVSGTFSSDDVREESGAAAFKS